MDDDLFHILEETGPCRMGRHVLHDPASRDYDAATLVEDVAEPRSVMHECAVPPWDQGEVGSCTANAALGVLMCGPFHRPEWSFTEQDAIHLYQQETRIDDTQIPGHWPPTDTGSTGLWSMKALRAAGYIAAYRHALSLNTALRLLAKYPLSTGVPWYESMFEPDRNHVIHVDERSGLAGGHQVAVVGYDARRDAVRIRNSWGTGWGDGGYCWLPTADWGRLLRLHGDVVVPVIEGVS